MRATGEHKPLGRGRSLRNKTKDMCVRTSPELKQSLRAQLGEKDDNQ